MRLKQIAASLFPNGICDMTDRAALLHAVCADPSDDHARLAYADFLQEQSGPVGSDAYYDNWHGQFIAAAVQMTPYPIDGIWGHHLLGETLRRTLGERIPWCLDGRHEYQSFLSPTAVFVGATPPFKAYVDRGMVSELMLPHNVFMANAKELFQTYPLRAVAFTSVGNWIHWGSDFVFSYRDENTKSVWPVIDCIDDFFDKNNRGRILWRSYPDAHRAWRSAVVKYGRQQAALPAMQFIDRDSHLSSLT